jgi:hypothetical protein
MTISIVTYSKCRTRFVLCSGKVQTKLSYRKNKIIKEDPVKELELTPTLKAISDAHEKMNLSYDLSDADKKSLIFLKYKARFPTTYVYDVHRLIRVKVHTEEYLVSRIHHEITDDTYQTHTFDEKRGYYSVPTGVQKLDKYGTLEDVQITGWRSVFTEKWTPKEVQKLVDGSRKGHNIELSVSRGTMLGKHPLEDTRSVFSYQEWLTENFEDLIDANKLNYLRVVPGGVADYKKARSTNVAHAAGPDNR